MKLGASKSLNYKLYSRYYIQKKKTTTTFTALNLVTLCDLSLNRQGRNVKDILKPQSGAGRHCKGKV